MKSLVAEMTGNFKKRLEPYNISVAELTGDQSLSREQVTLTAVLFKEYLDLASRLAMILQ